ncbi:hypothetical protein ACFX15_024227 [Malus domestica]
MLRPGPYVWWDLGGSHPWLFAINPAPRLRSSDPVFLKLVSCFDVQVGNAVDFTAGDDPWPIFEMQKEFNALGKSPPLSLVLDRLAYTLGREESRD